MPNKPLIGPYRLDPFQSQVTRLEWGAPTAGYLFLTGSPGFSLLTTRGYPGCVLVGQDPPEQLFTQVDHRPDFGGDVWQWANRGQTVELVGRDSGWSYTWLGDAAPGGLCDEGDSVWYPLEGAPGPAGQWVQLSRGGVSPFQVVAIRFFTETLPGWNFSPGNEFVDGTVQ